MKIFSNGQFDVKDELYVFDPSKHRFIPTVSDYHLIKGKDLRDSVFLHYASYETVDPNMKCFNMKLLHNGKVVRKRDGIIKKAGDNKIYESQVRYMLKVANILA